MRNTVPIMDLNNPDELIRANGAAEAAHTNRLREEVSDYTQMIEQLRDLYDRNNELVQKLQFMNRSQADEMRLLLQENNDRISEKLASLQGLDTQALQDSVTAAVNSSGDSVYRNIQASMISELGKQTVELKEQIDALQTLVKPDPAETLMRKVTFGLLAAVLAIQLLEGVGLLSLFLSMR